jgi:orotate phosphoribosyltransferase
MSRLIALLASLSAKRGDFVLASGRRSNLYVDCRLTAMHPEGQLLIGRAGLAAIRQSGWPVDSVGGLTFGALRSARKPSSTAPESSSKGPSRRETRWSSSKT